MRSRQLIHVPDIAIAQVVNTEIPTRHFRHFQKRPRDRLFSDQMRRVKKPSSLFTRIARNAFFVLWLPNVKFLRGFRLLSRRVLQQ